MTIKTKTCSKCGKEKSLDEFCNQKSRKDGKVSECKRCKKERNGKYYQEHREEARKYGKNYRARNKEKIKERNKKYCEEHKSEIKEKDAIYYENNREEILRKNKIRYEKERMLQGKKSMYENKFCASYLGIVIAERLVRHLFKDVKVMPFGNPNFDFICNKGKKIDVKSSTTCIRKNRSPSWSFNIDHNAVADFFILAAFDNIENLNPLHLWMIPGKELNHQGSANVALSRIHKWDECKMDINDAQLCCAEMKNVNKREKK